METMKPWEFKHFIEENRPSAVSLSSESQSWWYSLGVMPWFSLTFQSICVNLNPTEIIVSNRGKNGTNGLRFNGIDHISIEYGADQRTLYHIHCAARLTDHSPPERVYTLIAQ